MIKVDVPSGQVQVNLPPTETLTSKPYLNVGIKVSGGADSAITAYMVALLVRDFRPEIKLHPITSLNMRKPYQEKKVPIILAKIEQLTGIKFERQITNVISGYDAIEQAPFIDRLYSDDIIDCHFMGETLNPPSSLTELIFEGRQFERDAEAPLNEKRAFRPLRKFNKRDVAAIYAFFGLTDELFPLTRSCVKNTVDPEELKVHCQECWFCKERYWGFGRWV